MKVGSLVVCVKGFSGDNDAKPVIKGKIYTVREVVKHYSWYGLLLSEIVNPHNEYIDGYHEPDYMIERFRELDTPTEIKLENILELEIV